MERAISILATAAVLAQAGAPWRIPLSDLRLIRDYENFVYAVTIRGQAAVLRMTHTSHRSHADLAAELAFIQDAAAAGLPVCQPIASDAGRLIEPNGACFHVCCFIYAAGERASWRTPLIWQDRTFTAWGATLARMHRFSAATGGVRRWARMRWDEDDVTRGAYLPACDADIQARLQDVIAQCRTLPATPEDFGLIHGDVHQGNFHVDRDGALQLFDFDDACYHWFLYDLSVVFYHLPAGEAEAPPRPSRTAIISTILAGYQSQRALPQDAGAQLQLFLLLRDLQIYQSIFKKTAPEDRSADWQRDAAVIAERIRARRPVLALPI